MPADARLVSSKINIRRPAGRRLSSPSGHAASGGRLYSNECDRSRWRRLVDTSVLCRELPNPRCRPATSSASDTLRERSFHISASPPSPPPLEIAIAVSAAWAGKTLVGSGRFTRKQTAGGPRALERQAGRRAPMAPSADDLFGSLARGAACAGHSTQTMRIKLMICAR
jgi:hypothetical protein